MSPKRPRDKKKAAPRKKRKPSALEVRLDRMIAGLHDLTRRVEESTDLVNRALHLRELQGHPDMTGLVQIAREALEVAGLTGEFQGLLRCPFHDPPNASLTLREGQFDCTVCGLQGDYLVFGKILLARAMESARKMQK